MRITYILIALVVLLAVWSITAEIESQGQQRAVIKASTSYKVPLSSKEQRIVNNLKPGQVAVKTVIFAPDKKTANSIPGDATLGERIVSGQTPEWLEEIALEGVGPLRVFRPNLSNEDTAQCEPS